MYNELSYLLCVVPLYYVLAVLICTWRESIVVFLGL